MSESWLAEAAGQATYYFLKARPLFPTYLHLIVSAVSPIYAGAHASLHRPVSAGKPPKEQSKDGDDRRELQIEEETQLAAGFEASDILLYPLLAGGMLTGLYYLIKYLDDATLLSTAINVYLSVFGLFGIATFLSDSAGTALSYVFPNRYLDQGRIWTVDGSRREALPQGTTDQGNQAAIRTSPLPSLLSSLPIPANLLWWLRDCAHKPVFIIELQFLTSIQKPIRPTAIQIYAANAAIGIITYFNLVDRPWWMMNLLGFSFTYSAFQMMSPTRFDIGTGLLCALFFYDIYMVFYTPMMITVASKLDIPAKLVFPRPADESGKPQHAMLGLGDVVIPGIMIAFALRFDLYMFYLRKQRLTRLGTGAPEDKPQSNGSQRDAKDSLEYSKAQYTRVTGTWGDRFWLGSRASGVVGGNFPKVYFTAAMAGYVTGLVITLAVMQIFDHGQPALLYLVPCVLGAIWITGLIRKEVGVMRKYTEDPDDARKAKIDTAAILGRGRVSEFIAVQSKTQKSSEVDADSVRGPGDGEENSEDGVKDALTTKEKSETLENEPDHTSNSGAQELQSTAATKKAPSNRRLFSIVVSLPPKRPKQSKARANKQIE